MNIDRLKRREQAAQRFITQLFTTAGTHTVIKQRRPLFFAFLAALIANLVGVLLFFKPLTDGDTSIIAVHPAIGLFVYVGLCIGVFAWATKEVGNAYKGAFIVAAPQFILIVDLTLRGERGLLTAAAGTLLLGSTWFLVAYVYSRFDRSGIEAQDDA